MADDAEVTEVAETTAAPGEPMDVMTALQLVLKKSLAHHGLARGLREACKAVESRSAQLAVMAQDCDQPDYTKLVQALCSEANVSLITVPASKTLGEWCGLCKLDAEGLARKVVGCSFVVIKDYGEESEALGVVQEYLKNAGAPATIPLWDTELNYGPAGPGPDKPKQDITGAKAAGHQVIIAGAGGAFSGMSVTKVSVVRTMMAMDAAFSKAERVTFAGSMMPLATMLTY